MTDPGPITNKGGVWWFDAPIPRRLHRCKPQTSSEIGVQRCACGAFRRAPGRPWLDRNSRRRSR